MASLGMDYHHIPVKFDAPQFSELERFTQVMIASADERSSALRDELAGIHVRRAGLSTADGMVIGTG